MSQSVKEKIDVYQKIYLAGTDELQEMLESQIERMVISPENDTLFAEILGKIQEKRKVFLENSRRWLLPGLPFGYQLANEELVNYKNPFWSAKKIAMPLCHSLGVKEITIKLTSLQILPIYYSNVLYLNPDSDFYSEKHVVSAMLESIFVLDEFKGFRIKLMPMLFDFLFSPEKLESNEIDFIFALLNGENNATN